MYIFFVFIVFILAGGVLLSVAWSSISLAPFVPARKKDLARMFELANFKKGDVFYELGCGNGRVIIYGMKKYDIDGVGIEASWPLWVVCKIRGWFINNKNIKFKFGDLFKLDLAQADVVYFFGMPHSVKTRLKGKLERELKHGARVISYAFAVPGWEAVKISKPYNNSAAIYLYKM